MSDERTLELVSVAFDGELDPREQAKVERLLCDSSAAREFRDDLLRLETLLSGLPEPSFPDGLHARIMTGADQKKGERAAWWLLSTPEPVLRYVLAAAVGVGLTAGVYESQLTDYSDYSELAGTIAPGGSRGVRVLDRLAAQVDEFTGVVELQQRGEQLLLDIRVDAADAVELAVDFTAAGLRPVGITQPRFPFESIEIADQVLRARALGRQQMSVSLRRREDAAAADEVAIRLEYSSNGRVLKQGSLSSAVD